MHAIIYDSNLARCPQNLDNGLGFPSLSPSEANTREIGLLAVLTLTEYLILLEDLEFREIKSSETLA